MSFARAVATVGGWTMVSRVAGFGRDILTAAILGAGPAADAFFVALKLPNFLRRLFAEGAFSVSFVPLFASEMESRGRPAAFGFAEEALVMLVTVLVPFTAIMVAAMPWLLVALAPGFVGDPDRFELAVGLARITFPYLMLISLVALLGGILNALGRFGAFAAAPVAFNLTLVTALLLTRPFGWAPAPTLAWGVAAAGVVQLVWLWWACRQSGVHLRLVRPRLTPRVRRLLILMGPGAIGTGVMQINLFLNVILASLLPAGSVSFLYYADRLNQLPLGVIGIAIGTALLPLLSRHVEAGDRDAVREGVSRGLEFGLVLGLPAAIALAVAAEPIIGVLFERGAFDPAATRATAAALAGYAVGIPAFMIAKVLNTLHYARQDMITPVRVTVVATAANAALAVVLMPWLGPAGISLATGVAAWLTAGLLAWNLIRRGQIEIDRRLRRRAPRIAAAGLGMGLAVYLAQSPLTPWLAGSSATRFLALGLLVTGGLASFFALAEATGATHLADLRSLLRRADPAAVE